MKNKILVTLGPNSLKKEVISEIDKSDLIYLFRINLSHTPTELIEDTIKTIKKYTKVPICIDSEGAQIRNRSVKNGNVFFKKNDIIKVHFDEVIGDKKNISFTPDYVGKHLNINDVITIDFNSAAIKIIEKNYNHCLAKIICEGFVGGNKAADLNRDIKLDAITKKDIKAFEIGKNMGVEHFALSFAETREHVSRVREYAGNGAKIIAKIESRKGLCNIKEIIDESDEILIDRGDLSRQIPLEKIPFFQRRIISLARSRGVPVYVATNLLESMLTRPEPTRAEINDVISSLLMGANGLVLAAETAIGKYPVKAFKMTERLIRQLELWTPNTSIEELLYDN